MNRIVLVSCGKKKIDMSEVGGRSVKARDLYTSPYFKIKREWAEKFGTHWTILSAKFGTFSPTAWTKPYDTTLDDYPDPEDAEFDTLEEWGRSVIEWLRDMAEYHEGHDDHESLGELVVLAGEDYLEPWIEEAKGMADEFGFRVVTPLQRFDGIGEQMKYMKDDIKLWDEVAE